MPWKLTDDVETFAGVAGDFLRSQPVKNTNLLTVVDSVRQSLPYAYGPAAPRFGAWLDPAGEVSGAFVQSPPFPMLFSGLPPEAVPAAVDALAAHPVTAANLPAETADEFAARWRERTGATVEIVRRLRLYRLERLEPPSPPPDGSARTARPDDLDLVSRWLRDFYVAVGDPPGGAPQAAADRVGGGLVTLWEDGGSPVAMAVRTRVAAGMSRIQFVWTPRRLRRRGYAGGATTAATLAALDDGARDVVLNTDLGNATSNALYRRLGYRPIEDRMELDIS